MTKREELIKVAYMFKELKLRKSSQFDFLKYMLKELNKKNRAL